MELDTKFLYKQIQTALAQTRKADDTLETYLEGLGQRPEKLDEVSEKLCVAHRALREAVKMASGLKRDK